MKRALVLILGAALVATAFGRGADTPTNPEEIRREAAVAEFTRKMQAANYPALFEQAGQEFNVPADLLKAVAFAETRWEQLTWPAGETASPETGMPRPYGIMSLWDNPHFGHSLVEAAKLIGQDPEVLKAEPLQNMRGAAALLRKLYTENPKPEGTTEADIESWRYAVRKYCGIPEPDLNARHALDVYVFMSRGYHQYGIEWAGRAVNLEPIREETRRIVAEEEAKREGRPTVMKVAGFAPAELAANTKTDAEMQTNQIGFRSGQPKAAPSPSSQPVGPSERHTWWFIGAALIILILVFMVSRKEPSSNPAEK